MLRLDENFLRELGVASLPEDQQQELLRFIYQELQERVGERLAEGLTDAQMDEFDAILQQDETKIRQWLQANYPDYAHIDDYREFMHKIEAQDLNNPTVAQLADYTATKWLGVNRPHYKEVVSQVLEEIKKEIISNRDAILAT